MITVNTYFNEKFISMDEYAKITVDVEGIGMFAAIFNYKTKKSQVQKFIYYCGTKNKTNIYGRNCSFTTKANENFENIKQGWKYYNDDTKKAFYALSFELTRSMNKFFIDVVANSIHIEKEDKENIIKIVNDIKNVIYVCFNNKEKIKDESTSVINNTDNNSVENMDFTKNGEWIKVESSEFTSEDYKSIATKINDNMINKPFKYKDDYLMVEFNSGSYALLKWKMNGKEDVRKSVKMAVIKNIKGFNEFICGNHYPIKDEIKFDGKTYYKIQLENGEYRNIADYRVDIINMFTSPPEMACKTE